MVVLEKSPGATLIYLHNKGSCKIYWYFAGVQWNFIQQWEMVGYALATVFVKYCWKFIRTSRRVHEIVFIAFILIILMYESAFAHECPKSFGYLVIVGSEVLKMQLYCSFSNFLNFLWLSSRFSSLSWRGPITAPFPIPAIVAFYKLVEVFWVLLDSNNRSLFLLDFFIFFEIFKWFWISTIWFTTFSLVWFVALFIFF